MVNSLGDTLFDIWSEGKLFRFYTLWRIFVKYCLEEIREQGFEIYYMDYSKLRKSDMYDKVHHYYYSAD